MSKVFEEKVTDAAVEHKQKADALRVAYPYVKNVCEYVVSSVENCLREAPLREDNTVPRHVQAILEVLKSVRSEPTNMLMQIAESQGYIKASENAINALKEAQEVQKVHEEQVEKVAESIKSGELDPDARRKVGEKPPSLKNIRIAQEKIKSEQEEEDI